MDHPSFENNHCLNQSSDWEEYRDIIQRLYVTEDKPLPDVADEMKWKYRFVATERQYKRRISERHLDKNVKDEEMRAIIAVEAMRLRQGKTSTFHVRGRLVDRKKIDRFVQRKRIDRSALESLFGMQQVTKKSHYPASEYVSVLPANVRCSTPPKDRPAILKPSQNLGRGRSDRGLELAQDIDTDAMAVDTTSAAPHTLDYQPQAVNHVRDLGTKVVASDAPLNRTGSPHPSCIDSTSTNAVDGTQSPDRQSEHGLADQQFSGDGLDDNMSSPKGSFMENLSCCGITLASVHDLLQHYEEQHTESCKQPRDSNPKQQCTLPEMMTLTADTARSPGQSRRFSPTSESGTLKVIARPTAYQSSSQSSSSEVPDIHTGTESREQRQKCLDSLKKEQPVPSRSSINDLLQAARSERPSGRQYTTSSYLNQPASDVLSSSARPKTLGMDEYFPQQISFNYSLTVQDVQRLAHPKGGPDSTEEMGKRTPSTKQDRERVHDMGIDRTMSDIYLDELYVPSMNTFAPPPDQSRQCLPQEDSLPPQTNSVFTDRFQAAQNGHVGARAARPSVSKTSGRSPFTLGSPYTMAAELREQQKAAADARILLEHQPRPSDFVPPRTISPKEVTLD
ncbi:MAG: hypothetical protein Q9199_001006 [Rusavskia elegans]